MVMHLVVMMTVAVTAGVVMVTGVTTMRTVGTMDPRKN
jgi:hypothetical protein